MALTRIKTVLGHDPKWKRYHSGEYTSLEEIADPETWEDDTGGQWREWIADNQILVGVLAVLAVALVIYFSQLFIRVSTGLATNTTFQLVAGGTILTVSSYAYGIKSQRQRFTDLDWLVLPKDDGGVIRYLGYYREGDSTEAPLFVPVKGFRWSGHKAEPYRVYEVSSELARRYKNTNRDPEDVAVIRLEPSVVRDSQTDTGHVIVQQTTELKLDAFGNESNLKAPVSEKQADTDAVQDLKETMTDLREEKSDLKAQSAKFERQRNEWRRDARQRRSKIIDEFIEDHTQVAEVYQPRSRRNGGNGTDADELAPATQTDMQQLDRELAPNDD